jgi:hypothetical protein
VGDGGGAGATVGGGEQEDEEPGTGERDDANRVRDQEEQAPGRRTGGPHLSPQGADSTASKTVFESSLRACPEPFDSKPDCSRTRIVTLSQLRPNLVHLFAIEAA